jgi:hypothetical protein
VPTALEARKHLATRKVDGALQAPHVSQAAVKAKERYFPWPTKTSGLNGVRYKGPGSLPAFSLFGLAAVPCPP